MDIEELRKTVGRGNIEWRKHTLIRLAERSISQEVILEVILSGELIEDYPQDRPFPSCLIFKMVESKPYHVVAGFDSEHKQAYIITTYHPGLDRFEPGFKTRRK